MSQQSAVYSEEVEEMSPLKYARHNGLALDYLNDTTPLNHISCLQENLETDSTEDPNLPRFSLGTEVRVEERLECSREAALLLAAVSRPELPQNFEVTVSALLDSRSARRLKLELPLLKTDHELECKDFARREGFEIKLEDVKFPLEIVNDENNEGLGWPARFWDLGSDILEGLKKEKLAVSKGTLAYLQSTLKKDWLAEDDERLWISHQTYKKSTVLEPVTPPLSPIYHPPQNYEPGLPSSAFEIPILSDPPCLAASDLAAIEKQIFERDIPAPIRNIMTTRHLEDNSSDTYAGEGMVRLADIYSPLASLDNSQSPPSVEIKLFRRDDLKVEVPLTPPKPVAAAPKSVRFSNIIEELDLEPGSPVQLEGLESKFFEEAFGSAYEQATRQSEQEKLIEADATARVDVPKLNFSKPDPPWKALSQAKDNFNLLSIQKSMIEDVVGKDQKLWPGAREGHTKLRWQPFSNDLGKVALEDSFQYSDATWETFVRGGGNDDVIDSSSLTWKPPGLRILRDDDDEDDEIDTGKFMEDQPQDMRSLTRKRKIELGLTESRNEQSEWEGQIANSRLEDLAESSKSLSRKKTTELGLSNEQNIGSWLSGDFSARNELHKHFEIRGIKKPKITDSSHQKTGEPPDEFRNRKATPQQHHMQLPIRKSPSAMSDPLPAPAITTPSTPIYIIMSIAMYKKRAVVKNLERAIPTLNIIERDFSAHNTTTWQRGSISRSPITSPLAAEADFIVSPSLGIIITTLQKIKQKPLPGQKAKPEIRDRLQKVSARYEKLVVLVSEDRPDEISSGMENNDCLAFTEFVGFSSGLYCNIIVQFIGGGDEVLSKWLISLVLQHTVTEELLSEETHWELFLRRAGMNSFAAQSVLASLKAPDGIDVMSPSKAGHHGLTRFVEMGMHERIVRFKHICGVELLRRVSAVVDARWDLR